MILKNIRNLCKKKGVTIAEVERSTGIANGTIGKWDVKIPRIDNAKAVADYFEVSLDELLKEDENQNE